MFYTIQCHLKCRHKLIWIDVIISLRLNKNRERQVMFFLTFVLSFLITDVNFHKLRAHVTKYFSSPSPSPMKFLYVIFRVTFEISTLRVNKENIVDFWHWFILRSNSMTVFTSLRTLKVWRIQHYKFRRDFYLLLNL